MKGLYKISIGILLLIIFGLHPGIQASVSGMETSQIKSLAKQRKVRTKPLLPDLTIKVIKLTKSCQIKITIKNIGKGGIPDAAYSFDKHGSKTQLLVAGKSWGRIFLGRIDPGRKLSVAGASFNYIWNPGTKATTLGVGIHNVKVVVDKNERITEKNDGNNSKTVQLHCKGAMQPVRSGQVRKRTVPQVPGRQQLKPDLAITRILKKPDYTTNREPTTFTVYVRNLGRIQAPPSGLYLSVTSFRGVHRKVNIQLPGLPAGGQKIETWKTGFTDYGQMTFLALVSLYKNAPIKDANNSNNKKEKRFYVYRTWYPDLTIERLFIRPSNPTSNTTWTFTATIKNIGRQKMNGTEFEFRLQHSVKRYVGIKTVLKKELTIPALEVNSRHTLTFAYIPGASGHPLGFYKLRAFADPKDRYNEYSEKNNEKTIEFEVSK